MIKKLLNYSTWVATILLFVGALGILFAATPLFGNKALIVRSGSMEPAISVGDIVVVRAQKNPYEVGQVISYKLPDHQNMVVTHRISDASAGVYRTKGDANNEVDGYTVNPDQILGGQVMTVPYVGKLLAFAKTKVGFVLLVIIPAVAVVLGEGYIILRELRPKRARAPEVDSPPVAQIQNEEINLPTDLVFPTSWVSRPLQRPLIMDSISRRLLIFLAALAVMTPATWAQYSDTATSSNNVFTAAADFGGPSPMPSPTPSPTPTPSVTPSPTPSPTISPGDVVINEVMWMGSIGESQDEWIELRNLTSSPVDLAGWDIVNAGAGGSPVVTLSGTIPANGYFLVSARLSTHPNSALHNVAITVDQQDSNIALDNGGEQLTLRNNLSVTIDQTPAGAWPAGFHDANDLEQSMERNASPGDGTVASNWHTCTDASCNDTTYWDAEGNNYGTPKATNSGS